MCELIAPQPRRLATRSAWTRHLAIIDPLTRPQPMSSDDGRLDRFNEI
jgi:hypothetical protein